MSVGAIRLSFLACVVAALVILAEWSWLRSHHQAQYIAWANEHVEQRILAARVHLREQHWNEAIRELEDALDVEQATNRDAITPPLEEARRGQAQALLGAAGIALDHRRPNEALRLLRAYLVHPQAGNLERARLLHDDLERAFSDEEALRLLARLSDEALTVFAETGQLTAEDGLHSEATRMVFRETLRRNLAKEMQKREAQRKVALLSEKRRTAEQARRIARLRITPTFLSLSTFLTRTQEQLRNQQQILARQEAELDVLFRALDVNNAAERVQFRNDLLDRQTFAGIREQIERKREEVKRAFRDERGYNRADAELFDLLVDQEVAASLKMLPSS